jgi:hypothetical protein
VARPFDPQEWGYQAWNLAPASPITKEIVQGASETVIQRLDQNFFRVRYDRLTPGEKNFLRAMAELGPDARRTGDIANTLKVKVTSLGPVGAAIGHSGSLHRLTAWCPEENHLEARPAMRKRPWHARH